LGSDEREGPPGEPREIDGRSVAELRGALDDPASPRSDANRRSKDSVTVLEDGGRVIYVVGTAHVSRQSVVDVEEVIDEVRPDAVCVELDENRYQALVDEDRWKRLDIFEVIRQRRVPFLLAMLVLSAHQSRIGERLGVRPGAEMLAAIRKARDQGARLVLADRDVQVTIKRTWRRLSLWERLKLASALLGGFFDREPITEEHLEELKEGARLDDLLRELSLAFPNVKEPLIDERDRYLMSKVFEAPGERIVAVVGAAHVPGMVEAFGRHVDRDALDEIPRSRGWFSLLKWILPAIVLAAFYVGFRRHAGEGLSEMLWAWFLPNSILAALFSLAAGSRLLSALAAFVASPITSLNPTLAAGMVVGLVEAWLRRPTVEDCQRVREDAVTLRGLYRNRFTRVLLVSAMASLGSALGGWIGATWVLSLLRP